MKWVIIAVHSTWSIYKDLLLSASNPWLVPRKGQLSLVKRHKMKWTVRAITKMNRIVAGIWIYLGCWINQNIDQNQSLNYCRKYSDRQNDSCPSYNFTHYKSQKQICCTKTAPYSTEKNKPSIPLTSCSDGIRRGIIFTLLFLYSSIQGIELAQFLTWTKSAR